MSPPSPPSRNERKTIPPEHELVLLCSRSDIQGQVVERCRVACASGLDWKLVATMADSHRIFPLLYRNLARYLDDLVPNPVLMDMRKRYLNNSAACSLFSRQLVQLIDLFSENDIRFVPFKGPILAADLYGNVSSRVYGDLDLLVAKEDLRKAVALLVSAGYRFDIDLKPDQFLALAFQGFSANIIAENGPVELHWDLYGRYVFQTVELADVVPRLGETVFGNRTIPCLSPEDLLVYLCVHGNRHYWMELDHICSVAELTRKEGSLDWELAALIANRTGVMRMVALGCHLAGELLDARLHPIISRKIDALPEIKTVADAIRRKLFAGLEERRHLPGYVDDLQFQFKTMDHVSDRLRYSVKPLLMPTHSDWEWLPLPSLLRPLYYFLRPVRLLLKYAGECGQLFGKRRKREAC